ncbi:hypothetical protein A3Q56_01104 [Intoshia linei]|uniref:Thioredoxin domain-containing protein n=1 Tax=Intoshia linei TaxID=1819745 RepID=A0A177B9Y1_9BILA|nr:hypothetical protein A3Q56_01104 [Intoshia linei]
MILGDKIENFDLKTTGGDYKLYDHVENGWFAIFSHPADFTPVCTTELARLHDLSHKFFEKKVKVLALSIDSVEKHKEWIKDIQCVSDNKGELAYHIIADESRHIATKLGMLDPVEKSKNGMPLTCRAAFIFGPDKSLKLSILYPATTGRNFDEILRTIDSLQLTHNSKLATPVDWKSGDECILHPAISETKANKNYTGYRTVSLQSEKKYLRYYDYTK